MTLRRSSLDYLGFVVLAIWSAQLHLTLYSYAFDDAYIHLRVAEQYVETGQPYYNPGEAVMASSSPGWVVLLALLSVVFDDTVRVVAVLNAVVTVAGALVFMRLLGLLTDGAAGKIARWSYGFCYLSILHFSSVGLMETSLAVLLLGTAILLFRAGSPAGFLPFGALPFFRPELVVFTAAFLAYNLFRPKVRSAVALALAAVGALPFVGFQLYYFGTIVPHTVSAKSAVYALSMRESLVLLVDAAQQLFVLLFVEGVGIAVGLVLALLAASAIYKEAKDRGAVREDGGAVNLLLGGGALVALGYVSMRAVVFPWYVPLFAVPISFSVFGIVARWRSPLAWTGLGVFTALTLGVALAGSTVASFGPTERYLFFASNARVRQYLEVGARLYERFPDATLMSSEIGGLGHAFKGRIVDGVGLVSPEALKHHPMKVPEQRSRGYLGAIPAAFVEESRPELVASLEIFVEEFGRSPVSREYVRIQEPIYVDEDRRPAGPRALWGSRHLNVYVRRDLLDTN